MNEILPELTAVFRKVFRSTSLVISDNMTARDVPGWDSLTHMHLVSEVEKRFGVRFTFEEVAALRNVGDLLALVARKKQESAGR